MTVISNLVMSLLRILFSESIPEVDTSRWIGPLKYETHMYQLKVPHLPAFVVGAKISAEDLKRLHECWLEYVNEDVRRDPKWTFILFTLPAVNMRLFALGSETYGIQLIVFGGNFFYQVSDSWYEASFVD